MHLDKLQDMSGIPWPLSLRGYDRTRYGQTVSGVDKVQQ